MEITILIDNNSRDNNLKSEHGLSILVEYNNTTILFDTGKTDAFIHNAYILGKDLAKVDFVVLSHGHYDHTGGLEAFMKLNKHAEIIFKPEALEDKWSISSGFNRSIGFPLAKQFSQVNKRYIIVKDPIEVTPGFWVLPDIKRHKNTAYSDSYLFVKRDGKTYPDTFEDELLAYFRINTKLVVLTGCAHNGIENMLKTALAHSKLDTVELVVGGAHLNRASEDHLLNTIERLDALNIKGAALNHCSSYDVIERLNSILKGNISYAYTGDTICVD